MEVFLISLNVKYLKNRKLFINALIIISFIFLSFLSVFLFLKHNVVYLGFDTQFHFRRIIELKEALANGQFISNFSFNNFHGSSVMVLYPYLNLFPIVLLSFIINSKIQLMYAFIFLNILLTFINSFYSSKNYIHSYATSYIFSIVYSMSNVFLFYNIISGDFGIISSYSFLPLIIFGFLKLLQNKNSWIQLSLGMSLLLYSHIPNVIIVSIFLFIFLVINVKNLNKNIVINLFRSILLFIIVTSIIWLPFIYFYFSNLGNITMPDTQLLRNITFKGLMSGLYGSKNSNTIGFFPLISLFITPFFYKKMDKYAKQMYLLSLMIIFISLLPLRIITSNGIFKFLNIFQMMDRFLIIPLMLLSFIFALIIVEYVKRKLLLYISIICITIILQLFIGQYVTINKFSKNPSIDNYLTKNDIGIDIGRYFKHPIYNSNQFDMILNNYYPSDNDYIPKNSIQLSSYVNKNIGFYNNQNKIKVHHIGYNMFNFNIEYNINDLSLPIYVYNNEKLHIYLNDKPIKHYSNKDGLLTINNIHDNLKSSNNIYIKPDSNHFRIIGVVLSVIGWIYAFGVIIKRNFPR